MNRKVKPSPRGRQPALLALSIGVMLTAIPNTGLSQEWSSRLGSSHTSGKYHFTDRDFLNEGAIAVADAGMRVIKIWFYEPARFYMWNTSFPDRFENYVEMAKHPHFRELFRRPFDVYVLTMFEDTGFQEGCPDPWPARIEREYHDLTKHLLTTYRGTGKTFILGHHEGDWHLRGTTDRSPQSDPKPEAIKGMIRWYNARQAGTQQARNEVTDTDVKVYHAAEVNLVRLAMQGRPTVTNEVLPHIRCDLVSYSAYDSVIDARRADREAEVRRDFRQALDYIKSKIPYQSPFGEKNIFISEYGAPEQEWQGEVGDQAAAQVERVCRTTVEVAAQWGCPWIIIWEIYDNECRQPGDDPRLPAGGPSPGAKPASSLDLCRGFWLIRVDGTYSTARNYLTGLLQPYLVPPADFKAVISTDKQRVQLTWTEAPNEANYRIERSVNRGPYRLLSTPPKDAISFFDAQVTPGNTCQYRLRAERAGHRPTAWFYSE